MDIQMPVMSGYEAAVEIRALDKLAGIHTPIIAITATYLGRGRDQCCPVWNRQCARETCPL